MQDEGHKGGGGEATKGVLEKNEKRVAEKGAGEGSPA